MNKTEYSLLRSLRRLSRGATTISLGVSHESLLEVALQIPAEVPEISLKRSTGNYCRCSTLGTFLMFQKEF